MTGVVPDYFSGLGTIGIIASRAYGAAAILPTGAHYGRWRNFLYEKTKTTDKSSRLREFMVEMAAFNTFQVPLYATTLTAASFASHLIKGELIVDFEKVRSGVETLALLSPIAAPGTGIYIDFVRKLFGLDPAPREARKMLESEVKEEGE